VFFDEVSFQFAASPNLTDLDFLLESGSTVSTIGTRLPLTGSTTMVACQPTPVVPPAVPSGFLPRAASMTPVVPHVAQSSPAAPGVATPTPVAPRAASKPPAATDGPPTREWPSSPIVYAKRPR
jgi:hypothetical protein